MTDDDRVKLRLILQGCDETGLVALANKGLVSRAQKDLEVGGITIEENDAAILVRGPDWVVTMPPDGPTRATDSTKASGVTRQILTAGSAQRPLDDFPGFALKWDKFNAIEITRGCVYACRF